MGMVLTTQVGCPMRCTFCATGKGGFARNLKAHEIVDQVMTVQERFGARVSNVGALLLYLPGRTLAQQLMNSLQNKEVPLGSKAACMLLKARCLSGPA